MAIAISGSSTMPMPDFFAASATSRILLPARALVIPSTLSRYTRIPRRRCSRSLAESWIGVRAAAREADFELRSTASRQERARREDCRFGKESLRRPRHRTSSSPHAPSLNFVKTTDPPQQGPQGTKSDGSGPKSADSSILCGDPDQTGVKCRGPEAKRTQLSGVRADFNAPLLSSKADAERDAQIIQVNGKL